MSKINCNINSSSSGYQMEENNRGDTPLTEHTQYSPYNTIKHTSYHYDSFSQDQRPYAIPNEAKKRIDAALGLLKLKNSPNYL